MVAQPERLLLIEDDASLSQWIQEYLQRQGYHVDAEHRGDQALARVAELRPSLLILDIMLPALSGFEICRLLRLDNSLPILMLTARDDVIDQVVGLELGADDYVLKPVQPRILLARIQALLRRYRDPSASLGRLERLRFGNLEIDKTARQVTYGGQAMELSCGEFDLLWILAKAAGKPLNRKQILRAMRGTNFDGAGRSIDARVSQLRRKFNDRADRPEKIKTVWGKGYMFAVDNWL